MIYFFCRLTIRERIDLRAIDFPSAGVPNVHLKIEISQIISNSFGHGNRDIGARLYSIPHIEVVSKCPSSTIIAAYYNVRLTKSEGVGRAKK